MSSLNYLVPSFPMKRNGKLNEMIIHEENWGGEQTEKAKISTEHLRKTNHGLGLQEKSFIMFALF